MVLSPVLAPLSDRPHILNKKGESFACLTILTLSSLTIAADVTARPVLPAAAAVTTETTDAMTDGTTGAMTAETDGIMTTTGPGDNIDQTI